jgi:hypothetical protein
MPEPASQPVWIFIDKSRPNLERIKAFAIEVDGQVYAATRFPVEAPGRD